MVNWMCWWVLTMLHYAKERSQKIGCWTTTQLPKEKHCCCLMEEMRLMKTVGSCAVGASREPLRLNRNKQEEQTKLRHCSVLARSAITGGKCNFVLQAPAARIS